MEFEDPVDCSVHTNPLLNLSPILLNLISALTPYSLQLHFNIIFLHTLMSHEMSLEALCHLHAWNTPVWRFMLRNVTSVVCKSIRFSQDCPQAKRFIVSVFLFRHHVIGLRHS